MKKIFSLLFLCIAFFPAYGAMECDSFEPSFGEDVSTKHWLSDYGSQYYYCGDHSGDDNGCPDGVDVFANGRSGPGFYTCHSAGPDWAYVDPVRWISDCTGDPDTERRAHDTYEWVVNYAFFYNRDVGDSAKNICKISRGVIDSYLSDCEFTGGEVWRLNCFCYDPYEDDGPYKCKLKPTKFNYRACSSDSDCTGIDNTVRPYLHSTAWHCAWQSAGVRVCTATACESGWTPINGYCQEDKNTQTPQSENKNANSVSNIKTETKAGTKKPCTDLDNMDSNCKCIVVGTVERGGKCVCRDDNQEIKNGKCEWTAKYVAGLESDLDSKFNGLTATIGGFEKNVWRDENGEFNTARLASDSIAGVVLGTVGGIVMSNLVKKAQVKQGFEDIGCYIGGQSVAGYGDEFNVGR